MNTAINNDTITAEEADLVALLAESWDVRTHNGLVTLHNGNTGGHATFRIIRVKKEKGGKSTAGLPFYMAGRRVVSKLVGPDRSLRGDWCHFGYVTEEYGVSVWKSIKAGPFATQYQKIATLLNDLAKVRSTSFLKLLVEGKCRCCNKTLTNPHSVYSGIGPVCRDEENKKLKIVEKEAAQESTPVSPKEDHALLTEPWAASAVQVEAVAGDWLEQAEAEVF